MINYRVDPSALHPYLPSGTELDFYQGETFVSMVGFRFVNTRVFGWILPFHHSFEEVNLRFYVRRRVGDGWRRGVVFIRELVPSIAIAFVARRWYGEPYTSLPMRHRIENSTHMLSVEYGWRRHGNWETMRVTAHPIPAPIEVGSIEEFITEHYWGYTVCGSHTSEYQVEHPQWQISKGLEASIDADISSLYGKAFIKPLAAPPSSAFIASGSTVTVRHRSEIQARDGR